MSFNRFLLTITLHCDVEGEVHDLSSRRGCSQPRTSRQLISSVCKQLGACRSATTIASPSSRSLDVASSSTTTFSQLYDLAGAGSFSGNKQYGARQRSAGRGGGWRKS